MGGTVAAVGVGVRAHGTRESVLLGLVVVALLGFARVQTDGFTDPARPSSPAQDAQAFDLPGNRGQIAVSTTREDDVVVRWLQPDGVTWTPPEVAYKAGSRELDHLGLRMGGPTLAIAATYSLPDTDYATALADKGLAVDEVTVFVVCYFETCTTSREYAGIPDRAPVVSPDGLDARLAYVDGAVVSWHDGDVLEDSAGG